MPWSSQGSVSFAPGEDGIYKFIVFPTVANVVAWGLEVDAASSGTLPRRRVGFMVPFAGVAGRQLMGTTVEVFSGLQGLPQAFHLLDFSYIDYYPNLLGRVEGFGVAFAPDRGVFPCTVGLGALT